MSQRGWIFNRNFYTWLNVYPGYVMQKVLSFGYKGKETDSTQCERFAIQIELGSVRWFNFHSKERMARKNRNVHDLKALHNTVTTYTLKVSISKALKSENYIPSRTTCGFNLKQSKPGIRERSRWKQQKARQYMHLHDRTGWSWEKNIKDDKKIIRMPICFTASNISRNKLEYARASIYSWGGLKECYWVTESVSLVGSFLLLQETLIVQLIDSIVHMHLHRFYRNLTFYNQIPLLSKWWSFYKRY